MKNGEQMSLGFASAGDGAPAADILRERGVKVRLVTDTAAASRAVAALCAVPARLGLDIETEKLPAHRAHPRAGLDPHLSRIRLVQVHDGGDNVYVFDLRRLGGNAILAPLWQRPMVAHNALFELQHLLAAGANPHRIGCTLLQANALGRGLSSLAELARERLGWRMSKSLQVSDWSSAELSEAQIAYAAADAVAASLIADAQQPELESSAALRTYQLMRDAQRAVARLMLNGIFFDCSAHRGVIARWEQALAQAEEKLHGVLGRGVSASSAKQLSDWLEQHLDPDTLAAWPRTRTGRLRTSAHTLQRNAGHPLVAPLLAHREAATRLAAFGSGFAAHVSPVTGRIHAQFRLGAAASGRMACFDPNLQNIPREQDFRALFCAPPGRAMIVADYAQIELRVAAIVSGDAAMLAAYRRGDDLHALTAAAITGLSPDSISAEQRRLAKAVNFGLLYGQGARGLASYAKTGYGIDMSEREANLARRAFFETYPTLAAWQRSSGRNAEASMRVRTPCGRLYDFRRSAYGFSYPEALNIPIQGGAAEVMIAALARLDAELEDLDAKLVNVVHDEVLVEAAASSAPQAAAAVERAMTAGMLAVFPDAADRGLVEAKIGGDWAEAK